jgi:hypothetical protein
MHTRKCDPCYQNKLCISLDGTKFAIIRKALKKNKLSTPLYMNMKNCENVIDIFDSSNIEFFLSNNPLTKEDKNLL